MLLGVRADERHQEDVGQGRETHDEAEENDPDPAPHAGRVLHGGAVVDVGVGDAVVKQVRRRLVHKRRRDVRLWQRWQHGRKNNIFCFYR